MRILWWLLATVGLSLIAILLSQQRALDPLENLSLRITSPLERGLDDIARPVANFFQGIIDRGQLVEENQRLRGDLARLQAELAKLRDAQQQAEELKALLEVKQARPEEEFLVANVVARDPGDLKEAIAIDRGAKDGIEEGMVVVAAVPEELPARPGGLAAGTLVGTVTRALDDYAWVTLITDASSVVNALVQDSKAPGIVKGDLQRGLRLDLVPQEARLEPGYLVTTSGLGGNFPRALAIGTVTKVRGGPQELFQQATVEPALDLSRLETVLVMASFLPARLQSP